MLNHRSPRRGASEASWSDKGVRGLPARGRCRNRRFRQSISQAVEGVPKCSLPWRSCKTYTPSPGWQGCPRHPSSVARRDQGSSPPFLAPVHSSDKSNRLFPGQHCEAPGRLCACPVEALSSVYGSDALDGHAGTRSAPHSNPLRPPGGGIHPHSRSNARCYERRQLFLRDESAVVALGQQPFARPSPGGISACLHSLI